MGACKEVPKQCIFHLREGEVQMLEHHLKQYKKSTPRALLCTLLKKKSMLIAYVFKNTLNYSIKIKICLRK